MVTSMLVMMKYMVHSRKETWTWGKQCAKSVQIRSFCGPYFPVFGLNTETYGVNLHIRSKYGKIPTRTTPSLTIFTQWNFLHNLFILLQSKNPKTCMSKVHPHYSMFIYVFIFIEQYLAILADWFKKKKGSEKFFLNFMWRNCHDISRCKMFVIAVDILCLPINVSSPFIFENQEDSIPSICEKRTFFL